MASSVQPPCSSNLVGLRGHRGGKAATLITGSAALISGPLLQIRMIMGITADPGMPTTYRAELSSGTSTDIFVPRPHQIQASEAILAARKTGRPGFLLGDMIRFPPKHFIHSGSKQLIINTIF
jgi:hypothetical protein